MHIPLLALRWPCVLRGYGNMLEEEEHAYPLLGPAAVSGLSSSASAQARLTPPRLGLSSSALRADGSTSRLAGRSDTWLGVELG